MKQPFTLVKLFMWQDLPKELTESIAAKSNEYVPFEILHSDQHPHYTDSHVRLSEWLIANGAEAGESVLLL